MPEGGNGAIETGQGMELEQPVVMMGDLVHFSDGVQRVLVGYDDERNAVFMKVNAGTIDQVSVPWNKIPKEARVPARQRTLQEWYQVASDKGFLDMTGISQEMWTMKLDARAANTVLNGCDIRKKSQVEFKPTKLIPYHKGDWVVINSSAYVFLGYDDLDNHFGFVAKMDDEDGKPEWRRVPISEFGYYDHEGRMANVGRHRRYTTELGQPARDFKRWGREYYRAGGRIDGSVIQHMAGSEIMVVDFKKDRALRELYDQTLAEYEQLSRSGGVRLTLPEFIQKKIAGAMAYDNELVEVLVSGTLAEKIKESPNYLEGRDPGINRSLVLEAAKKGKLANKLINASMYWRMGFGNCRVDSVIEAALIERAIDQGRAPGWKGVEIRGNYNMTDGHAWVVLLRDDGEKLVSDPAGHYFGKPGEGRWRYDDGYGGAHVFGQPGT